MVRLNKFLRVSGADRCLLTRAMLFVWIVRLVLWLVPFRIVKQRLARFARKSRAHRMAGRVPLERVVWAVMVASRYAPFATCLTQALATKMMLSHYGHDAMVRIGVARSETGEFRAHAWVESDGRIVIGGSESQLKRYTPLLFSDGEM